VPEDQRPTQEQLSEESGIPQPTLSYWFDKFEKQGIETLDESTPASGAGKGAGRGEAVEKESLKRTTREAVKGLSEMAKNLYEQAINIGNYVVDKYGDLVKIALASGVKLEDFISEVFNWYEEKEEVGQRLRAQAEEIMELRELTQPNYIFKRKSQCILDFAKMCAELNKTGGHIPVKQAARALQHDLDRIEEEIETKWQAKNEVELNA
jgi:hypothetical protein